MSTDALETWRETVHLRLARLKDVDMSADFPFDFSPASLDQLEDRLLQQLGRDAPVDLEDEFVAGAAAYLGEALLWSGGGGWSLAASGVPVVALDQALKLAPISPRQLIEKAGRERTGDVLRRADAAVERAVSEYRKRQPGWVPAKELTPAVDDIFEGAPHETLTAWLTERGTRFPGWVATFTGGVGTWDFSPESLDALEDLVRQTIPSFDEFAEPRYREFVEGAAWYLGEVLRRHIQKVRWVFNPGEPGQRMFVGRPYVVQMIRDGYAVVPAVSIRNALRVRDTGFLRARLRRFRAEPGPDPSARSGTRVVWRLPGK